MTNIKKSVLVAIVIFSMLITAVILPGCKDEQAATGATEAGSTETQAAESEATEAEETAAETEVVAEKEYHFAIVVHEAGTPFMAPIKKGMEDAAEVFNVQADFMGPVEQDWNEQVNIMYTCIENKLDGLATPINDDTYMDQVIADAMDAGIPVISTNSDDSEGAKGNARIATVNQDHYNAGYAMGERIAAIHPDGGKVMLSWCTAGAVPLEKRMAGVKDGIADSNPKIEVVDPILNYGTVEADVPNNIEAAYLANPDVVGIYSVDGYSTGITKFIQNNNLKGKVKGGGWDLLQINLDGVKDGTIEFCLGQDPYSQGFFPIASLWLYLEKGVVPKNIDTGAEFCDINNVDVIYAREQEYWQ